MMQKPKIKSSKRHKFEEERARRVLMYCFPEKYSSAQLSEAPDIVVPDLSIGVEVTESMVQPVQQNMSRAGSIVGKEIDKLSTIDKENIAKNRVIAQSTPNGQYIAGFAMLGNSHDLFSAYIRKIAKLNAKHFGVYRENNLFMLSWMIDKDELSGEIQKILLYSLGDIGYTYNFNYIYICTEKQLITIDLKSQQVYIIQIPSSVMSEISEKSFTEVLEMTCKQYYYT